MAHLSTPTSVMARAWAIFRNLYGYKGRGGIPFRSIGRRCFHACLRRAWAELRRASALRAIPDDARRATLRILRWDLCRAEHADGFTRMGNDLIHELTGRIRELLSTAPATFVEAA